MFAALTLTLRVTHTAETYRQRKPRGCLSSRCWLRWRRASGTAICGVANSNGKEVRDHVKGAPGRPPGDFSLLLLAVVAVVVPAAAGGAAWAAHLGGK